MSFINKRWHIYVIGNGALLLIIPFSFTYYGRWLSSGTLPTDGDSIGIPIMENTLATFIFLSILNLIIWLATRHYLGPAPLMKWSFRTFKECSINMFTILLSSLILLKMYYDLTDSVGAYEWVLIDVIWIYFILVLKTAAIQLRKYNL